MKYVVYRREFDKKGVLQTQEIIKTHDTYFDACKGLREELAKQMRASFKLTKKELFTEDGNLVEDSRYFKDRFDEYHPYCFEYRGKKGHIVNYSVETKGDY